MNVGELEALKTLLDDPDPTVQDALVQRFYQLGSLGVSTLRSIGVEQPDVADRVALFLKQIGSRRMHEEIDALTKASDELLDDVDLETGALAIAKLHYPELENHAVSSQLDTLADFLSPRIHPEDRGVDHVGTINRYLFNELGFRGSRRKDYYLLDNSCMNIVLQKRRGIPISLTVLYLLLGQRLSIPLYGVSFPTHFLGRYRSTDRKEDFLFDPFNGGVVVSEEQCKQFLLSAKIAYHPLLVEPVDNRTILIRIVRNIAAQFKGKDDGMVEMLGTIIGLLSNRDDGETSN